MKIIVAADEKWAIGKDGDLLWHLSADMKFFRTTTSGHVVVMGRKTLDSFPGGRPLKNRTNLVLSGNTSFTREGTEVYHSMEEMLEALKKYESDDVFIIGGGTIYRAFLPYCDTAYVTRVYKSFEADTYFPNLDEDSEWELVTEGEKLEENDLTFAFNTYKRKA